MILIWEEEQRNKNTCIYKHIYTHRDIWYIIEMALQIRGGKIGPSIKGAGKLIINMR